MNGPITTIEEVELIAGDKSGAVGVLLQEIKKKDTQIEQLIQDKEADRARIQTLEDAMLENEGVI